MGLGRKGTLGQLMAEIFIFCFRIFFPNTSGISACCFCKDVVFVFADGIKEKDKNALSSILQQAAIFSPRDNSYTLTKHLYSEIRTDFPGYTETERQLVKR